MHYVVDSKNESSRWLNLGKNRQFIPLRHIHTGTELHEVHRRKRTPWFVQEYCVKERPEFPSCAASRGRSWTNGTIAKESRA